jgi:hypothetical protein
VAMSQSPRERGRWISASELTQELSSSLFGIP